MKSMLNKLRTSQKKILIGLLFVIVPAFVLWGGLSSLQGRKKNTLGTLNNKNITVADINYYLKMAKEWDVDGVVIHPLLSCRNSVFNLKHAEDALRTILKLPCLRIQGDIVDTRAQLPLEQLKPQIDAFIETVDYQKQLRKQNE